MSWCIDRSIIVIIISSSSINRPTKIIPAKISRLELSGKFPMDMIISPPGNYY